MFGTFGIFLTFGTFGMCQSHQMFQHLLYHFRRWTKETKILGKGQQACQGSNYIWEVRIYISRSNLEHSEALECLELTNLSPCLIEIDDYLQSTKYYRFSIDASRIFGLRRNPCTTKPVVEVGLAAVLVIVPRNLVVMPVVEVGALCRKGRPFVIFPEVNYET
jgi:hypothetical protein